MSEGNLVEESCSTWTLDEKLYEVVVLTLPMLGPEVQRQIKILTGPENLKLASAVLVIWVGGHAFGIGEIIDFVVVTVGIVSIGTSIFSGLDELFSFSKDTYQAQSKSQLRSAASHLASAIGILGLQTVLALLTKWRPLGGRIDPGPKPPSMGTRWRYHPPIYRDPAQPPGQGQTSFWGQVLVSTQGTKDDRDLALLHEKVHQFLAPKFYPLRGYRVENRVGSYFNSSLYRYCEEALAETYAQIRVNGARGLFIGLRFPVKEGYVHLRSAGGYNRKMAGKGLYLEAASLIASGMNPLFSLEVHLSSR